MPRTKRSLPNADADAPPLKKSKVNENNKENLAVNHFETKKKKKKPAKPYQCRASGYLCGTFQCLNTARLEFKALFGMNKLCIAWSDVQSSQIRNSFNPFGGFDFLGMQRAAQLLNNMKTDRVEIDIDAIDCIHITNGGDSIKLEIIINFPPKFTKQMSSRGRNKFNKSTDPTDGSAMRYRKHSIFLAKSPTANNIYFVTEKLKNGSERLKKLIDDEVYKQFTDITMKDKFDVVYTEDDIKKKKQKRKRKTKRKKEESDYDSDDLCQQNVASNKKSVKKKQTKRKKISNVDDDDEEWLP